MIKLFSALIISFVFSVYAFAATNIIGDVIKSSDRTKTWTLPAASGTLAKTTDNVSTATALAANPTDCGAGTKATAIDAQGNLTCSAVSLTADVSGNLPVTNLNSGTGASATTFWRGDGTWGTPSGTGSVTSVSVVSANGLAGSVANATTTPAITLSTTISGLLKGNGTAISAATGGTDYEFPLTFSTGLTRSTNTITVDTSQNISTLSNLTTNGIVYTTGGNGTLNSGPLTGDVTTSGAVATLANSGVTAGSYTSADITVDAKGRVIAASNGSGGGGGSFAQHDIYLQNGNGYGSTNTKIRRYSNVRRSTGSNLTLTQSATNGDSLTVNTAGAYVFCMGDFTSGGTVQVGISVNGSALTTNIASNTYAQGKRAVNVGVSNSDSRTVCWFGILAVNDVVRPHGSGTGTDTGSKSYFFGSYLGAGTAAAYLENGAGHGSTNTKIRTYTNVRQNTGGNITVNQSATNGDNFTVGATGIYAGCFGDGRTGSNEPIGITVNGTALTTNVSGLSYAQGLRVFDENATSGQSSNACFIAYLTSGDVVRVQDHGNSDYTSVESYFYLTEISSENEFIHASSGAGHGTTGTKIRTFSNLNASNGTDLQYRKSAVYGDSIKVNVEGQYVVCYSDQRAASTTSNAISLGNADATNAGTPLTYLEHAARAVATGGANYNMPQVCYSSYMYAGDIVKPHDDGTNDLATDRATFFMARTR